MRWHSYSCEFRLECGLPVWRYEIEASRSKSVLFLPHGQNTVHVDYRLVAGEGACAAEAAPGRPLSAARREGEHRLDSRYTLTVIDDHYEVCEPATILPPLRLRMHGRRAAFTVDAQTDRNRCCTAVEESRGYDARGDLWSPGYFRVDLSAGSRRDAGGLDRELGDDRGARRRTRPSGRTRAAASAACLTKPHGRTANRAPSWCWRPISSSSRRPAASRRCRARARRRRRSPHRHRRLSLVHRLGPRHDDQPGRADAGHRPAREAGCILRTFAHYIRDGLIPNLFPEGEKEGLYHTADATLWFFHAFDRYLEVHRRSGTLQPIAAEAASTSSDHHLRGTRFGIGVDPADGLLRQGAEGYQLTWMDAKVGDWVVTPRRGKAVEINALWYNALRLLEDWLRARRNDEAKAASPSRPAEARDNRSTSDSGTPRAAISTTWWMARTGDDASCQPNQLLAISLTHPVLDAVRWKPVLEVVRDKLAHAGRPAFPCAGRSGLQGELLRRPAAARCRLSSRNRLGLADRAVHRCVAEGASGRSTECPGDFWKTSSPASGEACVGSISEIFDAEPPFTPRGCIAQAWSVAEVLRSLVKTSGLQEEIADKAETKPVTASVE